MVEERPRVLFVGRTRYRLPLEQSLRRKFEALERVLDVRVLASAPARAPRRDGTFELVPPLRPRRLDGLLFYGTLPLRIAREARRFDPDAIVADSPHKALAALVARRLAGRRTAVVLEIHGDWLTATRLYGSSARRLLDPLADRASLLAVRRADAVRTLSRSTTRLVRELGVEPAGTFPGYVDVDTFLAESPRPLPERAEVLFVGVLERYKNVDGLVDAWRAVTRRLPAALLRIVGDGSLAPLVERLASELPAQVRWERRLPPEGVARALDESTLLVLPSRDEGLPRIALEALCRGRPIVATAVGGIPDVIRDGLNGLLAPDPEDPAALAELLYRALTSREALDELAAQCRESARPWLQTPDQFAERTLRLVRNAALRPSRQPKRLLAQQPVPLD
jgi:glycosyltransferase involved in cell wall biosynthesis